MYRHYESLLRAHKRPLTSKSEGLLWRIYCGWLRQNPKFKNFHLPNQEISPKETLNIAARDSENGTLRTLGSHERLPGIATVTTGGLPVTPD